MSAQATQPVDSSVDLLRSIAHELRQPLSTIESIAYYLSLVLPREGKVQEQLAQLQQLVEQSNWILTSGLQLSNASPASPELIDLEELITTTASSQQASAETLQFELAGDLPLVRLDPGLARGLMENLLMLFRQFATAKHPAKLSTRRSASGGVSLQISAIAPGFRSEATLGAGSVLSLRSARGIVEAHGGSLNLAVDPVTGIQLSVLLP